MWVLMTDAFEGAGDLSLYATRAGFVRQDFAFETLILVRESFPTCHHGGA